MDINKQLIPIIVDAEVNIKGDDDVYTTIHPITKESNIIPENGKKSLRTCKFDDVQTYLDGERKVNVMEFYADGEKVKTVEFSGGGGHLTPGTISTTLPSRFSIRENEAVVIPYVFDTPNKGPATLYVQVICGEKSKEIEYDIKRVGAGNVNIGVVDKGINEISLYAIDTMGQMTNVVTFTVVCGSIEIHSTFDDNQDFNSYAAISIPFNLSALDKTSAMVLKVNVDGIDFTQPVYDGYNSYTFPAELKTTGVHHTTLQVVSQDFQSNMLEYNVIIVDSSQILVSAKKTSITIEEGNDFELDYRISTIGQNMFNVKYFINNTLFKEQNGVLGINKFDAGYANFSIGDYSIRIEVSTLDGSITGNLSIALKVIPSSFKRIEFVKPGLQVWFDMSKKSNKDKDRDFLESEVLADNGRRAVLRLHDYNYSTNGWVDGRLVNNGISWAKIENYLPLEDNVPNGFTFDILFNSSNTGLNNAKVVSCSANDTPYQGFYIDSEKATLTTESNHLKTYYTDRTDIRVTFVVNRTSTYIDKDGNRQKNPMVQTFINGIFTEVAMLSDTGTGSNTVLESIMHGNPILVNTDKDMLEFGTNEIKSILIYNRPLDHEEVLQNSMADINNLAEQKAKYDKNYVTINQDLPTMYFNDTEIGKCDNMTKDTKQWINVVYVSPNKELYGPSFDYVCKSAWQGTSSLAYPVKNYKIKLSDYARDESGNIVEESKNDPKTYKKVKIDMFQGKDGNGYAERTYCLKADYMDSSHCRNTGTARLVNDFLFDGHPNPAKQIDPNTRDTINGFPIQLYINGKWAGVYNFNHDKSCYKTLGLETVPHTVRWEIKANSNTSEGAFHVTWDKNDVNDIYKKILTDFEIVFDEDAFEDKTGEYDVTKYYDEIGIPHEGTVMGTYYDYAILSLARFVNFVGLTEDPEEYRAKAPGYFNVEQACRYYLNTMTLGMIDNFAKNCIINMYGDDIWWFSFYDMDSSLGLDNTGYNKFETDIEPSQPNIYNCATSKMWVKLNDWLTTDVFNTFKKIREKSYTYENIIKYLVDTQIDIIPEIAFNRDMYAKYISQGRQYLHMLHGNNKDHLLRWLYNRFQYVDSLFLQQNSPYTKQNITIRSNKPYSVPADQRYVARFEIQTYCPQYVTIAWRKNTYETKRIGFNETVIFEKEMVNDNDNEIILYCAGNLKEIGDCTNLRPTSIDIGAANRLIDFKCEGSDVLLKADLSKNSYLRTVNFRGCSRLGDTTGGANILDVTKCTNLRDIDVRGTKITAVLSNVDGGNLESVMYSDVTQSIVLSRQTNMKLVGVPYGYDNIWSGLKDVKIEKGYRVEYNQETSSLIQQQYSNWYTVVKRKIHESSDDISLDNLWDLRVNELECILPVNGSNILIYFFDESKSYIGEQRISDTQKHDTLIVQQIPTPANARYCIISASFDKPMSDDVNIDKFGIVEKGNTQFKVLRDLANVQLLNCGNIDRLDIYSGFSNNTNIFKALSQVQNFTLDNSLGMKDIHFKGFKKLRSLTVKNMLELLNIGFDDMMDTESVATMYDVEFTNCPLIHELSLSVSSDKSSIRFASGATLQLSGLTSLETLRSNFSIKGLKKIILPIQLDNLLFSNEYGDGYSDIESIWSIDAVGDHVIDDYKGIDFKNMVIKSINMAGISNIAKGTNFNITPTEQHPNLNTTRDGSAIKPWFRPEGSIDLTGYLNEVEGMFKGLDLSKITINIDNPSMFQTNLNELFSDTMLPDVGVVNNVISKFPKAYNMQNLLHNAKGITSIYGLALPTTKLNLKGAFSGCVDLTDDIQFPATVVDVSEAFRECTNIRNINKNWEGTYDTAIKYTNCYMNCKNIEKIGEKEGTLSDVPRDWGGYGFDEEVTMLAEINTAKAGSKTIVISDYNGETIHLYTDWGDGTVDSTLSHTYARDGIYNIKTQRLSVEGNPFSKTFKESLIRVTQLPKRLTRVDNLFSGCINLIEASMVLNNDIMSLNGLFNGCLLLENVSFNLPTSCTDIGSLFRMCKKLTNNDVSNWDTSNITNMRDVFNGCYLLEVIDVTNWDVSKVTSFRGTFQDCQVVTELNIANWDVSKSTSFANMFTGCGKVTALNVSEWNMTNAKEINNMFQGCSSLTSLDVSKWDTSNITTMSFVFQKCESLVTLDLSNWDVSNVGTLISLCQNCTKLTSIDVSGWNTEKVSNMAYIFNGCQSLLSLDLSSWSMINANNATSIMSGCYRIKSVKLGDWMVNKLLNTSSMFQGCNQLTELDVTKLSVDNVTNMNTMFQSCEKLVSIDVSGWNTSNVVNVSSMFSGCTRLESLDLSRWDVSMITDMSYLFYECQELNNLNMSGWRTDNLLRMYSMFQNCNKITSFDIGNWDVSRVTDLNCLFQNCSSLVSIDLSKWDVSSVTELGSLFQNCISLKSVNVSGWNTLNVKNISYAFYNCKNLPELDLSSWDIRNADLDTSLYYTFLSCDLLANLKAPRNINSSVTIPNQATRENLVGVINNLNDRTSLMPLKLTLGSVNISKLNPTDIAIATNKNWSVV